MSCPPCLLCKDPAALREEGNALFKAGDVRGAVCCYTKALQLSDRPADSAVLYRNRSACYLKLEEFSKAETDATKGRMRSRLHGSRRIRNAFGVHDVT